MNDTISQSLRNSLEYFPVPVDFFSSVEMEIILDGWGVAGQLALLRILARLYSAGYALPWNRFQAMAAAAGSRGALTADDVNAMVSLLVECDFFDAAIFNEHSVLTSRQTQETFATATQRRRIDHASLPYWLLDPKPAPKPAPKPTPTPSKPKSAKTTKAAKTVKATPTPTSQAPTTPEAPSNTPPLNAQPSTLNVASAQPSTLNVATVQPSTLNAASAPLGDVMSLMEAYFAPERTSIVTSMAQDLGISYDVYRSLGQRAALEIFNAGKQHNGRPDQFQHLHNLVRRKAADYLRNPSGNGNPAGANGSNNAPKVDHLALGRESYRRRMEEERRERDSWYEIEKPTDERVHEIMHSVGWIPGRGFDPKVAAANRAAHLKEIEERQERERQEHLRRQQQLRQHREDALRRQAQQQQQQAQQQQQEQPQPQPQQQTLPLEPQQPQPQQPQQPQPPTPHPEHDAAHDC